MSAVRIAILVTAAFFLAPPAAPRQALLAAEPLRVMSFNIRFGSAPDGANEWSKRRPLLLEVIKEFDPDVLGVQEALHFQLVELTENLDGYAWIGVGRDDGVEAGEYSAILYKKSRLRPAESGTFWFSDEPTTPGSMTWGNHYPRICTWGLFDDLAAEEGDAKQFRAYNVHWDHEIESANVKSGKVLAQHIADEVANHVPAIVTGDFNSASSSVAFKSILGGSAGMFDTFLRLHPEETNLRTFNGYQEGTEGEKIDAVVASSQWDVQKAEIIRTTRDGVYPSDHYPVTAVLVLRTAQTAEP